MTAKLILSNPRDPTLVPIEVAALADTVNPESPNIATGIVKHAA